MRVYFPIPVRMTALACAIAAVFGGPASALNQFDCDWRANAFNLVEPWGEFTRTFSNGKVRLALLDTVEPAAQPHYILIVSPPEDEMGNRQCVALGYGDAGFANVDWSTLEADYDPAEGLIFAFAVEIFDPETDSYLPKRLQFTLDQQTGRIVPVMR